MVSSFRRVAAEFFGTALLLCSVIGSGIFAEELTQDAGIRVLINAVSIGLALGVLIWWLAPVSGAHFNPIVTLAALIRREVSISEGLPFIAAQMLGGVAGTLATNLMFDVPALEFSSNNRLTPGTFVSEVFATAMLIALISALGQRGQGNLAPLVIGAWIIAAIFFTSSTTFANPAVTLARIFTDSMTGINPSAAAGFAVAQLLGLPVGIGISRLLKKASNA